jgi:hypothetical protein
LEEIIKVSFEETSESFRENEGKNYCAMALKNYLKKVTLDENDALLELMCHNYVSQISSKNAKKEQKEPPK